MDFKLKKPLFGDFVEITLYDIEELIATDIAEAAYREALRLQKIFNFYDKTSEISLLNKKRKLTVSKELLEVIKKAKEFADLTDGEYDISLGRLFRQRKSGNKEQKISCSYKDIEINNNEIRLLHKDVELDLGSIAKGYIVDKIVENLKSQGVLSGLVNGRGDIIVFGDHTENIGIQHPRNNTIIKNITLKDSAVATSGDYNQYKKSYESPHIINKKDIISTTVIAPSLILADVFATVIFVSKKEKFEKLLKKNKYIKALTIDKTIKLSSYNNFEENFI